VEQLLNVKVKHWRTTRFKPVNAHMVACSIILLFTLTNSHLLFTIGFTKTVNGTHIEYCFELNDVPFVVDMWEKFHLCAYFLAPSIMLVVSNITLIFAMKKKLKLVYFNKHVSFVMVSRAASSTCGGCPNNLSPSRSIVIMRMNQINVTKMIIIESFLFILMTMPTSFASFYLVELVKTDVGMLFLGLSDSISLTFNAFSMFLYVFFNKIFRHEFKIFFSKLACYYNK
jgi:hypothetical protein